MRLGNRLTWALGYRVSDQLVENADEWMATTPVSEGSWWPEWDKWVRTLNPAEVAARTPGAKLTPIEDAPGTYVKVKLGEPVPKVTMTVLPKLDATPVIEAKAEPKKAVPKAEAAPKEVKKAEAKETAPKVEKVATPKAAKPKATKAETKAAPKADQPKAANAEVKAEIPKADAKPEVKTEIAKPDLKAEPATTPETSEKPATETSKPAVNKIPPQA